MCVIVAMLVLRSFLRIRIDLINPIAIVNTYKMYQKKTSLYPYITLNSCPPVVTANPMASKQTILGITAENFDF